MGYGVHNEGLCRSRSCMASVAVVVLDTLRYDVFNEVFDWLEGRRFTRAYAPSHWTIPVHGSLFTGLFGSEIGVHGDSPSMDYPGATLPEQLQRAGFRTRLFTANPQMGYYEGWDRGFDEFVTYGSLDVVDEGLFDWGACFNDMDATGARRYAMAVRRCLGADCDTVRSLKLGVEQFRRSKADGGARSVKDRVRATDFGADEFLFVNLMETHTPYHPPDGGDPITVVAADAFADEPLDLARARAGYRRSAAYLAEQYREIFADLQAAFDYVITLSDHGELLGEHGLVNHSFGVWPELTHVPLVVSGEGIASEYDHRVTSLLDVHQTVADLAGVDVSSRGEELLSDPDPKPALFEYHGLLPFHEGQFDRKDVPVETFERRQAPVRGFVSADGAYAHETHTRGFRTIGSFDEAPRETLESLTGDLESREVEGAGGDVSASVRDQLEDLGYA